MKPFHIATYLLVVVSVLALSAGCTYESSLGDATCSEEGQSEDGRVCRDGYWVAAGDVIEDTEDAEPDVEPDVTDVDIDTDAESCDANEERCNGECVDTSTSPQHCGGCGLTCVAYGSNSVAECGDGSCTRYCEAGFSDVNGDWLIENPTVNSDGCEELCTRTDPPTEVCDGVDNDCDGRVDNAENEWYRDSDGDGYGAEGSVVIQCERPSDAYVEQGGDCNDGNDQINPGIVEECSGEVCTFCNGRDDNCDGIPDDNCPCSGDETQPCFPFSNGSPDEGLCSNGQQQCEDGTWGTCEGATGPEMESCDGMDNDCDGNVDNGFPDKGDSCTVGTGACENSGTLECNSAGDGLTCSASPGSPSNETCDGTDEDCDGTVDNGFPDKGTSCSVGTGACENTGTFECNSAGDGVTCSASPGSPSNETCDGTDEDCDGTIDNGFPDKGTSCTVGTGACQNSGTYECNAGGDATVCSASPGSPSTETCDGTDEDCDGTVDNGFPDKGNSCTVGTGACENTGTYVCNSSGSGTECSASPGTPDPSETCGNGIDDDCNGMVDDGCTPSEICNDGMDNDGDGNADCADDDCNGQSCGPIAGATCTSKECVETVCDGLDNDGDSSTDEGCDDDGDNYCDGDPFFTILPTNGCSNTNANDTSTFDCEDSDATIFPGATEECDGVDSDCDGQDDSADSDATTFCENNNNPSYTCIEDNNNAGDYCCVQGGGTTCP
jgi:hypothetical protein